MSERPPTPPPLPPDPVVTLTQHAGELRLQSNLSGPQALLLMRQMLLQGADMVLLQYLQAGTPTLVQPVGALDGLRRR